MAFAFASMYALGLFSSKTNMTTETVKQASEGYAPFVAYRFKTKEEALKYFKQAWAKVYKAELKDYLGSSNELCYTHEGGYSTKDSISINEYLNDCVIVIDLIDRRGGFYPDNWLIAYYLEESLSKDELEGANKQ